MSFPARFTLRARAKSGKSAAFPATWRCLHPVAPTRKIQINSMSANVHVALPGDIRGFVADISSMSGKIVNEFGRTATVRALPIHMDTMSGKLMLTACKHTEKRRCGIKSKRF